MIVGFVEYPETLNRYGYCWNSPLCYADLNGLFPIHLLIGGAIGGIGGGVTQIVSDIFSGKVSSFSTYIGAVVGGAAGGATFAGTGDTTIAEAVEAGVTEGVTTLGNGIESMIKGTRSFSAHSVAELVTETIAKGTISAISTTFVGGALKKTTKLVKNPLKFLKSKIVDKAVDGTLGKLKNKVFRLAKLQGRNSWESLTKQAYTNLRKGTWKKISKKTLKKMIGFEIIDSATTKTIDQVKQKIGKLIPEIDLSVFTDESINYLKKISEDISPKQLGKLSYCFK